MNPATLIAVLALFVSFASFILGPVAQYARSRRHVERAATRALGRIVSDVMSLMIERLEIRFDRKLLKKQGPTLREYRASAALKMLGEIDVVDLPVSAVDVFVRFRCSAEALNLAMNAEGLDKDVPLPVYKKVFEGMLEHYEGLQIELRTEITIPTVSWRPSDAPSFKWSQIELEQANEMQVKRTP